MLLIFNALIICALCHFVVPMTVKSATQIETQITQKKHRKKKTRKKTSISKHDILNFFKNIAFIILGTFQILVLTS